MLMCPPCPRFATPGAELFECLLLDADPCINTANWRYNAGLGADPRDRVFRTVTQGEKYDAAAELVGAWVPELAALPPALRHRPWLAEGEDGARAALYPAPVLDVETQVAAGPRRGQPRSG